MTENITKQTKKRTTKKKLPETREVKAQIRNVELAEEINRNKNIYAYSINLYRSFIDVRDGQKIVTRRVLYSLEKMKAKDLTKVSAVSGFVLGNYHPHGEASVNDALVKLGQWFYNSYPLVGIHGNWGSITGDGAAAPRYIECKQGKMHKYLMESLNENSVNWSPNYQNKDVEPETLPVKFPLALINGGFGIGQGYKCQVPPHNFEEVCDMTINIINNPNITLEEVAKNIRPDFPTGGVIVNEKEITDIYINGRGNIKVRGEITRDENNNSLIITSIPFFTNTGQIVDDIQNAVKEDKISDITRIVDRSKNSGVNILIKLKKGTDLAIIENLLFKHTKLESTIPVSLILAEGRSFRKFNILEIFQTWIQYRKSTLKRILNYRIANKRKRVHVLEGLLIFLNNVDEGIKLIKSASDKQDAMNKLVKKLKLSMIQAETVVEMQLYRLTKLSLNDIKDEKSKIEKEVEEILSIVGHESNLNKYIIDELNECKKVFKRDRVTKLSNIDTNISEEDLVEDTEHNVFITEKGYIKKTTKDNKSRGKMFGNLSNGDYVISAVQAKNKDNILLFSDTGKVFSKKLYEIRDHKKEHVGDSISSYIGCGEKIITVLSLREKEDKELLFLSSDGDIKRTKLSQFKNIKNSGIIATRLNEGSKLLSVTVIDNENDDILISTKNAMCARFQASEVPCRLRAAGGVQSINLAKGDEVISAIIINKDTNNKYLGVIESDGCVKKFPIKTIPNTKRGVKGRLISKKKEDAVVTNVFVIDDNISLLNIITDRGSYKINIDKIPEKLRTLNGKVMFNIKKNESIQDIIIE